MTALRWLLILFQFAWLNVLMPGHVRGQVTMPSGASSAEHACCADEEDRGQSSPDRDQRQRCAVCYFAGTLAPPAPVVFWQPRLGLVRVVEIIASSPPLCISIRIPYLGRAPPGAIARPATFC